MKIFNLPINSTSFGVVSFGILNELYKRNEKDILIANIGKPDLSSFDKRRDDVDFIKYLNENSNFLLKYKRDNPCFKLWHINGSESVFSKKNTLFTFHEADSLTPVEVNILNSYEQIIVSCEYSKTIFEESGVITPIAVIPLGFDSLHFNKSFNRKIHNDICSITVNGKLEKRKGHFELIPLLLKKFANNPKYIINLCVYNIHLSPEQNNGILLQLLQGNKPFNFNIHPFYQTLSELNNLYANTDIILNGSYAESFSIPDFTCVGLGKYAVVNNAAGVKQWANKENCFLVEPEIKKPMIDGMFFPGRGDFNVGNWSVWNPEDFSSKIDMAIEKWQNNPVNNNGLKLQEDFTWEKSVDKILKLF